MPTQKPVTSKLVPSKLTAAQLRKNIGQSPFLQTLGVRLTGVHPDGITMECEVTEKLRNVLGSLHGGVSASLADAAVAFAIYRHVGGSRTTATVDLKINYFRPITEGHLYARARLLRVGSTLCVGAVDLTDSANKAVGTALVTYMLLDKK